jgi:hypothetical protein
VLGCYELEGLTSVGRLGDGDGNARGDHATELLAALNGSRFEFSVIE